MDWDAWHREYDDPASNLSRRLAFVQAHIRDFLNSTTGPVVITSACAGDGRDILDVLATRDDAGRATVTLLEFDERNVARARQHIERDNLQNIEIRQADAGNTSSYAGAVPADLLLMCGVMGNITDGDIHTLIQALPGMVRTGSSVVWTRARWEPDLTGQIREWFAEANFEEESFTAPGNVYFTVGRHRYLGEPRPLATHSAGTQLFTFVR